MRQFILQRLQIVNFKGIRDLEINFNPEETTISGDNGLGKTTIAGAFNWLLTGKDQFDSAKINDIKTYDAEGKHIEKLEHWVEGTFLIDGFRELTLRRLLTEKWRTPRGETVPVLDGHTTDYFINGVGCGTEREFKEEVDKIIGEKTFKLLTNPLFFNTILSWQDRRDILFAIAPPIGDEEVVKLITNDNNKERIITLNKILNSGASFERHKKDIAAKKKTKKEQLALIPAKVTSTERMKPELPDGGFGVVEFQISKLEKEIKSIDEQIADKSKANEAVLSKQREKQEFLSNLKLSLQQAEFKSKEKHQASRNEIISVINGYREDIKTEERAIDSLQKQIDENTKSIANLKERKQFAEKRAPELEAEKKNLLEDWKKIEEETFVFDESDFSCPCPTCKRDYNAGDIQSKRTEFELAFNEEKSKKLDAIDNKGLVIKKDFEQYTQNISKFDTDITELEEKSLELAEQQSSHKETINQINEKIKVEESKLQSFDQSTRAETPEEAILKKQIQEAETPASNQDETITAVSSEVDPSLIEDKNDKQSQLDNLRVILSRKEQIEKADKLIAEYKSDEKKLAQEVADLEKDEDIMSEFTRTRIESIESRISGLFRLVKFKMFDEKLNGEISECCEATVNGVPFAILNTAMKVNSGLDIVNVLSDYYQTTAPIFIDNRESISELIPTKSQIINLEKVKGQKQLLIQ